MGSTVGEMWWNVFASKACQFLRALGSVMVLIVLGLVGLTYYTTVSLVYGPLAGTDTNDGRFATAVLVIYHGLILMVLWSYFACVLTEPGKVPDGWTPPAEDEEAAIGKSNSEKLRRFCRKCSAWKPERCHHCSVCGRCVLKMDHHCVWVANCVGAYNYKFFLLFLSTHSSPPSSTRLFCWDHSWTFSGTWRLPATGLETITTTTGTIPGS